MFKLFWTINKQKGKLRDLTKLYVMQHATYMIRNIQIATRKTNTVSAHFIH